MISSIVNSAATVTRFLNSLHYFVFINFILGGKHQLL